MLLLLLALAAGFFVGVVVGPTIHKMIKTAQSDCVVAEDLKRGEVTFPKSNKPLISEDEFWGPGEKKKRKGKRKGK